MPTVALEWMVSRGMNEYISKDYIRNLVQWHWDDSCGAECYAYGIVLDDIDEAPIADMAPVKYGRWYLADDGDGVVCGECGQDFCNIYLEVESFKYCPNCGAYMRETY